MNATLFLRIIATILLLFGVIYLLNPALLAGKAGITAEPSGLTDIRATYGGFQIGFALFLWWACRNPAQLRYPLMATLVIFASVGAARFFGVIRDGELSGFNQIGLGFEIILTVVCAFYLFRDKKKPV
jgi:uncharacterized membrane protein